MDQNNKGDWAIVLAVQELLRRRFKNCRLLNFPVSVLQGAAPAVFKRINACDLVVIGGGGLFYSYFLPYAPSALAAIKKPIVIFGVGYIREVGAPALRPAAVKSVARLAQRATLIGVRDHNTKRFLIKAGVAPTRITVIGDPAVLLKEKRPRRFKISGRRPLSASGRRPNAGPVRIGLNLNYSGWLGFGEWREDILNAYRAVAAYFQKKYGGPDGPGVAIYYLQHHPGEKNIYPTLVSGGWRVVNLPPAEQKYVYGRLDLVVGMMLHSGVLAFGAGTPAVSVAYDLRNYSFAEFIGCPELAVDLADLKRGGLLRRVKAVWRRRRHYQKYFAAKKAAVRRRQAGFLQAIKL
jgi:polysaccharide pyruvyl transferase WcaK-like protein